MRLFWEITSQSIRRQFTYRAATLAGLMTNFAFGMLRAAVMVALYKNNAQVEGISLLAAITYTGLSQATIGFLSLFNWFDIMRSVYTGEIASDLLKPMDYFSFWLAQDFGRAMAQLILRGLPIMIFYALVFDITIPNRPEQWLVLAITLLLAWLVSFCWRFLINLAGFWSPNALGFGRLAFTLAWFMSGFLMPLRFFPDWFVSLCYLTPFPHTVNTVIEVYLGVLDGGQIARALLNQAIWIVGLVAVGQWVLRQGVRRLVIQGG